MENKRIAQLIQNPDLLNISDGVFIEQELEKHPFVQAFHYLNLKWKRMFAQATQTPSIEKLSVYSTYRELIKAELDKPVKTVGAIMPVIIEQKKNDIEEVQEPKMAQEVEIITEELIKEKNTQSMQLINIDRDKEFEVTEKIQVEEEIIKPNINKLGISYLFSNKDQKKEENIQLNKEDVLEVSDFQKTANKIKETVEGLLEKEVELSEKKTISETIKLDEIDNSILEEIIEEIQGLQLTDVKLEKEENIIESIATDELSIDEAEVEPLIEEIFIAKENIEPEEFLTEPEKLPFNQWLILPKDSPVKKKDIPVKEKQKKIIEKFIEANPKIETVKKEIKTKLGADFKKEEIKEIANLMTVTLAKLYIEQAKYDTAITAFKILSLKYPEKSSYFATEIKRIKKIKNSK